MLLSNRIYDYYCVHCFLSFLTFYNTMIFSNTVNFTCLQGTKIYYSQSMPEQPPVFSKHLSSVTLNIFLLLCSVFYTDWSCIKWLALSSDLFHNTKGIFTCQIQVINILSNNKYICIISSYVWLSHVVKKYSPNIYKSFMKELCCFSSSDM